MRELQHIIARLLRFPINPRKNERVLAMARKLDELGGLQFKIKVDKHGWRAECKNLRGITTGGKNPDPTISEIDRNIKDAIFSAFGIPPYLCDERMILSPFDLEKERAIEQIRLVYRERLGIA